MDTHPKISISMAVHFITNSSNVWAVDENMKYLVSDINPEMTDQSQLSKSELWVTFSKQIAINRPKTGIVKKCDARNLAGSSARTFRLIFINIELGELLKLVNKFHIKDIKDISKVPNTW